MYSGNAPSSFATGDVYSQPPSQGDMNHGHGNSLNQFEGATTYRESGQPTVIADNNINTKPPSFTDLKHGQLNSHNQDSNMSRGFGGNSSGYSGSGQAPSRGALVKVNDSQTSDGHVNLYSKDGKAPDMSDVDRRGSSETGTSSTIKLDVPDAQELVGISLVGKNFRKFYPNAYYREEDED